VLAASKLGIKASQQKERLMNKPLIAIVIASCVNVATFVQAEPSITLHFPNIGDAKVFNDVPGAILNIKSSTGLLSAPTFPNGPIGGGSFVDLGDLPHFIALLNVPVGNFQLGPGTINPNDRIALDWYPFFGAPATSGAVIDFRVEPEPASIVIAGIGLVGLLAASRRRRCIA
jgi:hypothetical protein